MVKFIPNLNTVQAKSLDQRPRSGSDLLVNRDLMRQMNVAVNPNRTFVLSKRLRPIEKEGKQDKVGFEKK